MGVRTQDNLRSWRVCCGLKLLGAYKCVRMRDYLTCKSCDGHCKYFSAGCALIWAYMGIFIGKEADYMVLEVK